MRLLNQLNLKILALVSAIILWFIVITVENNVTKFPEELPISVVGQSENFALSTTLPNASLFLKMDATELKQLSSNDIEVFIDLNNLAEGKHSVNLSATVNGSRSQVLKLEPAKVTVELSSVVTREVPVKLKTVGQQNKDYILKNQEISPEKIKIQGAKSVIDQIKELTALYTFTGLETTDITAEIAVTVENIQAEDLIILEPEKVTVTIELESKNAEKEVPLKPKFIRQEDETQFLSRIEINPTSINVKGEGGIIESLTTIETLPIEISILLRNESAPVKLNLPQGVTLVDPDQKITIKLQ